MEKALILALGLLLQVSIKGMDTQKYVSNNNKKKETNLLFVNLLTPSSKNPKYDRLTEWAKQVHKKGDSKKVKLYLLGLFWQFNAIVDSLENNNFDEAYQALQKINRLYSLGTQNKNSILNDTWKKCLVIEDELYIQGFTYLFPFNTENDMDSFSKTAKEEQENCFRECCKQARQELMHNYQNMCTKVINAGAALNNMTQEKWVKYAKKEQIILEKKEVEPFKTKKTCVIN